MPANDHLIGAVLPKASATSAAIDLENAGLLEVEVVAPQGEASMDPSEPGDFQQIETGPHEVLVVVDSGGAPDRAAEILVRHGGRLVGPRDPDVD